MKFIFLFTFILSTIHASENRNGPSNIFKKILTQIKQEVEPQCLSPFLGLTQKYKTTNQWFRIVDPDTNVTAYRSPTLGFAQWIEIEIKKDKKELLLKFISPQSDIHHTLFAGSKCLIKQKIENRSKTTKAQDSIKDSQLKKIMKKGQGLFYVWSPRMIYSMKYFKDFKNSAQIIDGHFYAFMDPSVEDQMAYLAGKSYKISKKHQRRLASIELEMRQYDLHFPTTYVYAEGKLHPERIVGVMPQKQLIREIKRRLQELRL